MADGNQTGTAGGRGKGAAKGSGRARHTWLAARRRVWDEVPWSALLAAVATLLLGGLAVNTITGSYPLQDFFPCVRAHPLLTLATVLLLFVASSVLLLHQRRKLLAVRHLAQHLARPHRGLVILLSSPKPVLQADERGFVAGGAPLASMGLKAATIALAGHNWQQILRGIGPHAEVVERVYLIGSDKTPRFSASFAEIENAGKLIRPYLPRLCSVGHVGRAVNFEQLDDLLAAIGEAVDALCAPGLTRRQITVDVTGGQKTTSIAGAVFTLNSRITFQYVQTDDPYDVIEFDLEIEAPTLV